MTVRVAYEHHGKHGVAHVPADTLEAVVSVLVAHGAEFTVTYEQPEQEQPTREMGVSC